MKKRLGDLLVEAEKITADQLKEALALQKDSGKKVGQLLIEIGFITEEEILEVLELQLGIPRVDLNSINIQESVVQKVPENLCKKHNLVAFDFKNNKLSIAMSDPLNIYAIDDVKIICGFGVDIYISNSEDINNVIDRFYSSQYVKRAAEDLSKIQVDTSREINKVQMDEIKASPAVRLVDSIIDNAQKMKASDIHIEPFEDKIKIRNRVDGVLQESFSHDKGIYSSLISRIKILSGMNIAEKRIPQDGRILTTINGRELELRVSSLPTVHGEKVVMRVIDKEGFMIDKNNLGIPQDELEKIERIIRSPYGIVLVTGPTGSGKSTTLYSMLKSVNEVGKNIITVEDPVEYVIEGINQVNINTKAGLTFASGLRSILRQDPDIIMIGEIRDNDTADIAIRAAITGHLVLSTIHTNDASSAVIRLLDMDIQPFLVANAITGIIAQRLVRKTCIYCSTSYLATDYEKDILGVNKDKPLTLYKGKGCARCINSGYSGRTGIYEVIEMSKEHRGYIAEKRTIDEFRNLSISKGMKTLKQRATELVLNGITTMEELVKVAFLKE
ncbi:GspE/PulE family protein [Clostridium sp.]|uniref:GspE/PulE family protein n=1 Tax=Clostridium sp. TaxID=1506 RepID=UPI002FCA5971